MKFKGKKIIIVGPSPNILNNNNYEKFESYDIICRIKKSFPVPKNLENSLGERTDILLSNLKLRKGDIYQNNFDKLKKEDMIEFDCEFYIENNPNFQKDLEKKGKVKIYKHFLKYGKECKCKCNYRFKNKINFILFPYPLINQFERFYTNFQNSCSHVPFPVIYQEEEDSYNYLKKELNGYEPTIFMAGIYHLLKYELKELYITGITFQRDGYINSYRTDEEHDIRKNQIKNIHNMDNEINLLKKLIEQDKRIKVDEELEKILND